jgi:hypothetical protein
MIVLESSSVITASARLCYRPAGIPNYLGAGSRPGLAIADQIEEAGDGDIGAHQEGAADPGSISRGERQAGSTIERAEDLGVGSRPSTHRPIVGTPR